MIQRLSGLLCEATSLAANDPDMMDSCVVSSIGMREVIEDQESVMKETADERECSVLSNATNHGHADGL